MAHYAKVDRGNVLNVIVAEPEFFDIFVDSSPGEWIKTSYNMRGGVYYDPETRQPAEDQSIINGDEARMRKNYAVTGGHYDKQNDAFYDPQPYPSWILNTETFLWEPPVAYPDNENFYIWDESSGSWAIQT